MTSQLAREFTKGIRDEVEDVAAMFKKMAIIKDTSETEVPEEKTPAVIDTARVISLTEKLQQAMRLAKAATGNRSTYSFAMQNDEVPIGTQISFFDVA